MAQFPCSLTSLLCELIARPSVSPEGDSGGTLANETAMAEYVAQLLREMGGEVSSVEVKPGRPNVLGYFPSAERNAPVVVLAPHLDTVGVKGMTIPPFAPKVEAGRIWGRGASDTKGPMAAALWALRRYLKGAGARASRVSWVFAATMGEEELSTGASALCADGLRADFAIALEPTDLHAVYAAKGVLRVWVEAEGVSCHSSTPEKGDNAVYKLLPFLQECAGPLQKELSESRHPDLGPATLNVGVIEGGRELNIVADKCRVGIDMRTHPACDNSRLLARIEAAAKGLSVRVHCNGAPYALSKDHAWVRALARCGNGVATAPWFSDANVFNGAGIPAVAFGPGKIAQAHTKDEFISIKDLEDGARAFEGFLADVSERPPAMGQQ